jgi:hypothetical protein
MIPSLGLRSLDSSAKDGLIQSLIERLNDLTARLGILEAENAALRKENATLRAKLDLPPKTPDNSSTPPSQGVERADPQASKPHAGPQPDAQTRCSGRVANSAVRKYRARRSAASPDEDRRPTQLQNDRFQKFARLDQGRHWDHRHSAKSLVDQSSATKPAYTVTARISVQSSGRSFRREVMMRSIVVPILTHAVSLPNN